MIKEGNTINVALKSIEIWRRDIGGYGVNSAEAEVICN